MAFPRNYLRFVGAMSLVFGLLSWASEPSRRRASRASC